MVNLSLRSNQMWHTLHESWYDSWEQPNFPGRIKAAINVSIPTTSCSLLLYFQLSLLAVHSRKGANKLHASVCMKTNRRITFEPGQTQIIFSITCSHVYHRLCVNGRSQHVDLTSCSAFESQVVHKQMAAKIGQLLIMTNHELR